MRGGTLVYGVEGDTANPWVPYRSYFASSGYVVLSAISDSLFGVDKRGNSVPVLAAKAEHNADYTSWTVTVRDGIRFHDGTPLDGAAVKFNLESCVGGPLTSVAYSHLGAITASGQSVTIATKRTPWVALPAELAAGQCGYMMSPKWLATLPDLPQRQPGNVVFDPAIAAVPATGNPAAPVGSGAFRFQSYTPGNGNSFKAVRNEDYWRGPNGVTGEQLPYLDGVEVVVSTDADGRSNALRSRQFDIMHTSNSRRIVDFLGDPDFETISSDRFGETVYVLLNVAQGASTDPGGVNAKNPLTTLSCRRALAQAIDLDRYSAVVGASLARPANGPFPPGSHGNLADSGYPKFDVSAAQAEMEKCLQERSVPRIELSFSTTSDPVNVENNTLVSSMWREAFGDKLAVTITPVEQGQYIGRAISGNFQAFGWRSHGGTDPDQQLDWWSSATAAPIGKPALNLGRFTDAGIDKALGTIRTDPNQANRDAATEAINRRFGDEVYNLWLGWAVWGLVSAPHVNDQDTNVLPGDVEGVGLALSGRHALNQIWCAGGKCE